MRVARWILGIAVAVVLLALAAVLIATLVINPDRYKGRIESAVRRATGRPLVLEGHLRLTWFPWLGVSTGAARLGGSPGAGGPDLLDWKSATVRVRLLPLLLHRQLEIGPIRIVGADIHLRRGPHGEASWDDLLSRLRAGGQTGATPTPAAAAPAASAAGSAAWAGLDLEESSLDYLDEASREQVSLSSWRLRVGPGRPGQPLSVSTSFVLHVEPLGNAPRRGAGTGALRLPPAGVRIALELPRLRLQATPLAIAAPQWSLQVEDAQLRGSLEASRDAAGRPDASGSLTAAMPSLRALALSLGITMPSLADPAALGPLSLSAKWRYQGGALAVEPLAARLDATALSGRIARAANPASSWTFALRADQIDFDRYLTRSQEQKPLELPVSALRALHAQGTLELDRAEIDGTTLKDVRLQVQ